MTAKPKPAKVPPKTVTYRIHFKYGWKKTPESGDYSTLKMARDGAEYLAQMPHLYTDIGIYRVEQRKVR